MNLVLFDFDDTMTRLDTTILLGVGLGQRQARFRLLLLVLALGLFRLRLVTNTGLKRVFARLFLRGQPVEAIERVTSRFYHHALESLCDEGMLDTLRMHVNRGDSVYLVSANFDQLLEPLVGRWSLTGVIATQAELQAGVCTGGIVGLSCHGHEKLRRVLTSFGRSAVERAIAYGNQDDAPLLRAVGKGYLVCRAKPPGLLGRFGRSIRMLTGKPNQDDLSTVRTVELFPAVGRPEAPAGR